MILGLESLRGLAALFIAFYHYPSESILYYKLGYQAVYLFFSLSGFVITLNYFNKINNLKSLFLFQKKRLFRLYPVHLFVLILILLIQCLKFIAIELNIPAGTEAFGNWYTLRDFILHIFLLQAVFDYGYLMSWNSAAWSISTELYTYLIFGILVLISFRKSYIYITLSIIYLIFFQEIFQYINSIFDFRVFHDVFRDCILYFLSGSLMFFIYKKVKFRINDFIFYIILIPVYFGIDYFLTLPDHALFSLLVLSIALLEKKSMTYILLNNKSLVYLGTISYSFYMIHQVVLYCYIQVLKIFNLGVSFSNEVSHGTGSIFYDTMITISYTIISILIAIFIHRFIESKYRIK